MDKQVSAEDIKIRAEKIKLLLMDCDGVLTDGKLYLTENGEEMKVFHVRDGQGLVMWHNAGFRSGVISGRNSKIVKKRAAELEVHFVKQGSKDKAICFEEILAEARVSMEEVAFVGDDVQDIVIFEKVGLPIAVADAVQEVFPYIIYKTKLAGGFGAVREVIDLLLRAKMIL
ncbi:MAG: HAD hydrolase family protein [Acidobacteria bacterium]|jgi:3-deoxy-D-manno-octulosonate 8-phosphate phosphatase (KDO 8-P phosphatase)|nr:HAD hydrolase family protein [Acidobacteriota bacterium]